MKSYFTKKHIFSVMGIILVIIMMAIIVDNKNFQKNIPPKNTQINRDFLFVVSWSPTYCMEQDPQGKQAQCRKNSAKQYRFIVHGLWPQSNDIKIKDNYLTYCHNVDKRLEGNIVEKYFYLMPSSGLMGHQWQKHASCGNFTQQTYFKTIEDLYQRFKIANMLKNNTKTQLYNLNALVNILTTDIPNIAQENIVISCRKNYLSEMRICLNNDYSLRKCRYNEIKAGRCRISEKIIVPVNQM